MSATTTTTTATIGSGKAAHAVLGSRTACGRDMAAATATDAAGTVTCKACVKAAATVSADLFTTETAAEPATETAAEPATETAAEPATETAAEPSRLAATTTTTTEGTEPTMSATAATATAATAATTTAARALPSGNKSRKRQRVSFIGACTVTAARFSMRSIYLADVHIATVQVISGSGGTVYRVQPLAPVEPADFVTLSNAVAHAEQVHAVVWADRKGRAMRGKAPADRTATALLKIERAARRWWRLETAAEGMRKACENMHVRLNRAAAAAVAADAAVSKSPTLARQDAAAVAADKRDAAVIKLRTAEAMLKGATERAAAAKADMGETVLDNRLPSITADMVDAAIARGKAARPRKARKARKAAAATTTAAASVAPLAITA